MDAVLTRMAVDAIGPGTVSREFAAAVAKYLDRRGGVAFRSRAAAITAVIASLGLPPGSRIGLCALCPADVFFRLSALGMNPVLIDSHRTAPILSSPLDLDYQQLQLQAIFVDTRLGFVPDLTSIVGLNVPIIEDISEGLGASTSDRLAGCYGDTSIVAVESEHVITAGGGAICVSNNTKRIASLTSATDPQRGEPLLSDLNAALGLTQIRQIERFVERRQELAERFSKALAKSPYRVVGAGTDGTHIYSGFPVRIEGSVTEVEGYARAHGVATARALADSAFEALRHDSETVSIVADRYPNAQALASTVLTFPLYPSLSGAEVGRIERVLSTLP